MSENTPTLYDFANEEISKENERLRGLLREAMDRRDAQCAYAERCFGVAAFMYGVLSEIPDERVQDGDATVAAMNAFLALSKNPTAQANQPLGYPLPMRTLTDDSAVPTGGEKTGSEAAIAPVASGPDGPSGAKQSDGHTGRKLADLGGGTHQEALTANPAAPIIAAAWCVVLGWRGNMTVIEEYEPLVRAMHTLLVNHRDACEEQLDPALDEEDRDGADDMRRRALRVEPSGEHRALPAWLAEGEQLLAGRPLPPSHAYGSDVLVAWECWWRRNGSDVLRMALHDYRSGGPCPPDGSSHVSYVMDASTEER